MDGPNGLYTHSDGTTETRIRPEYRYLFEHSPSSSFLAYLPIYFSRQVLFETNQYAKQHAMAVGPEFTINELMKFLGIQFYMALSEKGEYANYWRGQIEDQIFGTGGSTATAASPTCTAASGAGTWRMVSLRRYPRYPW